MAFEAKLSFSLCLVSWLNYFEIDQINMKYNTYIEVSNFIYLIQFGNPFLLLWLLFFFFFVPLLNCTGRLPPFSKLFPKAPRHKLSGHFLLDSRVM